MGTLILNGKKISKEIEQELVAEVAQLRDEGINPCLAVILVGKDPASQVYVKNKERACERIGIESIRHILPATTDQRELVALVKELNADPRVNGILVQLPIPKHIDEHQILPIVNPRKDVDGFTPLNVAGLMIGSPCLKPCTPSGIIELLKRYNIPLKGKKAVVIGRSNIVGKPLAMLLLAENCTVSICHSWTENLVEETNSADILIAAVGRPKFVTAKMVRRGAIVIDVGINMTDSGLCGDVNFASVQKVASAITPVPGGVGPMTIAMLMKNTVMASKL